MENKKVTKEDLDTAAKTCAENAFYNTNERYGGPLNSTTYPAKHYTKLEKSFGMALNAIQIVFFDRMYNYYMKILTDKEKGRKVNLLKPYTDHLDW